MDIPTLYNHFLAHRMISTDTRKITPGCIFFALKGENFDGNLFAKKALELGASLAVVSDNTLTGPAYFHSHDTLETLQALANFHRKKLNIPVLAITGSNGKTTTKEMITDVLSIAFRVHATVGNFNNHIGVPLTLLSVPENTEIVVCEMGANHPGEIKFLCSIAEPTHGLITNIGNAHLEGFGSIEGVQKTKGELFEYLSDHEGYGFINLDDSRVEQLSQNLSHKTTFGLENSKSTDIHLTYSTDKNEPGFTLNDQQNSLHIHSKMFGRYNASNMLAAYTIGMHFEVDQKLITSVLSNFISKSNRSEELQINGCTFIMDAYNANPSSMELAVRAFAEKHPSGWVVLGDMKELGGITEEAHLQIISLVSTMKFGKIILVGKVFSEVLNTLKYDSRINSFTDTQDLKNKWDWEACAGQTLLLKGSRSMQLEQILKF